MTNTHVHEASQTPGICIHIKPLYDEVQVGYCYELLLPPDQNHCFCISMCRRRTIQTPQKQEAFS